MKSHVCPPNSRSKHVSVILPGEPKFVKPRFGLSVTARRDGDHTALGVALHGAGSLKPHLASAQKKKAGPKPRRSRFQETYCRVATPVLGLVPFAVRMVTTVATPAALKLPSVR